MEYERNAFQESLFVRDWAGGSKEYIPDDNDCETTVPASDINCLALPVKSRSQNCSSPEEGGSLPSPKYIVSLIPLIILLKNVLDSVTIGVVPLHIWT